MGRLCHPRRRYGRRRNGPLDDLQRHLPRNLDRYVRIHHQRCAAHRGGIHRGMELRNQDHLLHHRTFGGDGCVGYDSAREHSGDIHAAHVVNELRAQYPDVEIEGIGGENLKNAGVKLFSDQKKMGAVGLSLKIILISSLVISDFLSAISNAVFPSATSVNC